MTLSPGAPPPSSLENGDGKKNDLLLDSSCAETMQTESNGGEVRISCSNDDIKNGANDGKKKSLDDAIKSSGNTSNAPNTPSASIQSSASGSNAADNTNNSPSIMMPIPRKKAASASGGGGHQQRDAGGNAKNKSPSNNNASNNDRRDATTNSKQGGSQNTSIALPNQISSGGAQPQPSASASASNAITNINLLAIRSPTPTSEPAAINPTPTPTERVAVVAPTSERDKKILAIIKHRRQLLSWVREGRIESQRVLGELGRGARQGFVGAMLNNDDASLASEIADYQQITSMANRSASSLKRAKSSGAGGGSGLVENNPRDLRRGSSVGKRMNNAVSALTHNAIIAGGWVSSSTSGAMNNSSDTSLGAVQQPPGSGGPIHPSPAGAVGGISSKNTLTASANSTTLKQPPSHNKFSPGKLLPHKQPSVNKHMQHVGASTPAVAPSAIISSHAATKATTNEKQPKKKRIRSNSTAKKHSVGADKDGIITLPGGMLAHQKHAVKNAIAATASASASAAGGGHIKLPHSKHGGGAHTSKNNVVLPPNNKKASLPHPTKQALVPSMAAVTLLGRRDGVIRRLNSLLRRRQVVGTKEPDKLVPRSGGQEPQTQSGSESPGAREADESKEAIIHSDKSLSLPGEKPLGNLSEGKAVGSSPQSAFAPPTTVSSSSEMITKGAPLQTLSASLAQPITQPQHIHPHPKLLLHKHGHPPIRQLQPQPPPHQPPRLPLRRKTQWDCVLEEMTWMAHDYHEERKWKMAASKTLSMDVKKQHRLLSKSSKKMKRSASSSSLYGTPSKSSGRTVDGSRSTLSSRSTPRSISDASSVSRSRILISSTKKSNNSNNTIIESDPLFEEASEQDVEKTRKVARLLSVSILDHWEDATASIRTTGDSKKKKMAVGKQRFQRLKEAKDVLASLDDGDTMEIASSVETSQSKEHSSAEHPPKVDDDNTVARSPPKCTELGYDEISSQIESSIEHVITLKDQHTRNALENEERSIIQKYNKSMEGGGGEQLSYGQLHAIQFVEKLWWESSTSSITCSSSKSNANEEDKEEESGNDEEEKVDTSSSNNDIDEKSIDAHQPPPSSFYISAILGGGLGVGKTFAVCALLWKNRHKGVQLIICSPGALIRWSHELQKFNGLNGRIYGLDSGEETTTSSYGASDVVLCDYGSFSELVNNGRRRSNSSSEQKEDSMNMFASLILDLRHVPSSTVHAEERRSTEDNGDRIRGPKSTASVSISPIDSVKWWIGLNNFISKSSSDMKRLVVEQTSCGFSENSFVHGLCEDPSLSSSSGNNGKTKRMDEKMLAMRVAFMYGPSMFLSECGTSIGKRVVSWAKRHGKKKGKKSNGDDSSTSIGSCRCVLVASLQSMYDSIVNMTQLMDPHNEVCEGGGKAKDDSLSNHHAWELLTCTLGKSQQVAYDQCCSDVRGSDKEIADSLLKLRKLCIHSNLDEMAASLLAPQLRRQRHGHRSRENGSLILVNNSATFSEPNIAAAKKVVTKSSKMKELLHLLISECGHDVARKYELIDDPSEDDHNVKSAAEETLLPKKKARVLILASLVEAQLLTSFFLSAVGLHHEVLVSSSRGSSTSIPPATTSCNSPRQSASDAWAWSQDVLSQFNGGCDGEIEGNNACRTVDILIASPNTISSQNGGIGATSADTVISIDEDWSGREALHTMSILSKIRRRELGAGAAASSRAPCRFIKLVCQETCEDTFLCQGNATKDRDETKSARETAKREAFKRKVVTRRSSRQSARSKTNQDETAEADADAEKSNSPDCNANTRKPMIFLRPMKVKLDKESINSDGFLVPPSTVIDSDDVPTRSKELISNEHAIGYNVLRYRNSKLSSVLCSLAPGLRSNQLFLPKKSGRSHHRAKGATDCNVAFLWALFDAEDDASRVVTVKLSSTSRFPEVSLDLRSIALGPSIPSSVVPTSVRRYVESFGKSSSFISQGRSEKQMRLLDHYNGRQTSGVSIADNPDSSSKELGKKGATSSGSNSALLVYGLSDPVSRKRKISDVEFTIEGGDRRGDYSSVMNPRGVLAQSIFSLCFSSFNSSTSALVQDGNRGCEPLVYFPAFLPSLLQMIQNMISIPRENNLSGVKRKDVGEKLNGNESKRLKISSPNEVILHSSASLPFSQEVSRPAYSVPIPNAGIGLPAKFCSSSSSFSFSVETTSFVRGDRNVYGNAELAFNRRLLAGDLRGAVSCQDRPALNSMILITQKKRQPKGNANIPGGEAADVLPSDSMHKIANHAGKKSLHKKIKKQYPHTTNSSSPNRDKSVASYFQNDHLFARSFSAREGMNVNVTASLMGRVRLQCHLNDVVSSSFTVSLMDLNRPELDTTQQQSQLSMTFSIPRSIGPVLLGVLPRVDEETMHIKERSRSGITLPAGVKMPRLAKKFSSSLGESSEPWADIEDTVLQESVLRYGMNWHLAAHAISSGATFSPASIAGGRELSGNVSRRSAAQCQNRWVSLTTNEVDTSQSSLPMVESAVPRSDNVISTKTYVDREVPLFVNGVGGCTKEAIVYDGSSSINQMEQEPCQTSSLQWLGRSRPASAVSKSSHTLEKTQSLIARVRMLKEVSKKRRIVTTPLLGSMPTHASHTESIQTARANMLSAANGIAPPRHEMWPLELLDFTKKHKAAAASQNSQRDNIPRASASHSVHPSQSTHRQQSSVPYHPHHNVHPTQHQMYHGAGQIPNQHPTYHHQQGHMHQHHAGANPNVAYQTSQQSAPRHNHRPKEPRKGST